MKVRFVIDGCPQGKGRPKFARHGNQVHTYTPEKTAQYEDTVRIIYKSSSLKEHGKIICFDSDTALGIAIKAYFPIPKSASKHKQEDMRKGLIRPLKKCDADNIAKIICDSLNGLAYADDKQIAELTVGKWYSDNPRVETELYTIQKGEDL